MSGRKGNNSKRASAASCSPSVNPPKLSPGWNKVALLTAVRNSPCSCPFSVSLHPPQAALNSEPRKRWRLIVRFTSLHIKPALKGEVANVVSRRGYKVAYSSCLSQPLSQTFGLPAPRQGSRSKNGFHCIRHPATGRKISSSTHRPVKNVDK